MRFSFIGACLIIALAMATPVASGTESPSPDEKPDIPSTRDDAVVGVLFGKAYTFGALKPENAVALGEGFGLSERALALAPVAPVIVKFRETVLTESVRRLMPHCGLNVTPEEIDEYIGWWVAGLKSTREAMLKYDQLDMLESIDRVGRTDRESRALAEERISRWKRNKCLYGHYGGGRLLGPQEMILEHYRGERSLESFQAEGSLIHRTNLRTADPLDAYQAHYDRLVASGELSFPDPAYETAFFAYLRNEALKFVPVEWEDEFINREYWREFNQSKADE